jgi:type IV secretory pathway TrbL component
VPDEERHAAADRVTQGHRRGIFPECTCAHCAAALREAGAAKKQRVSGAVEHSAESEGGSAERGDSAVAESAGVAAVIGGAGGSAQHRSASAAAAAVIAAPRSGSSGGGDANTESGGVARNSA